jgi:hypothetical protein
MAGTRVTTLNLTDEEEAALIQLLQQTVEDARFAYVHSLAPLKTVLERLVPSKPRPPLPPRLPASAAPSRARRRRR